MASSTVVPAAPAAAPSAPSAPAAPSTPAVPSTPPPAPPAPPASQPDAPAQPATPAQPDAPAQPPAPEAPAAGAARPKADDFPDTVDGFEQFVEANEKWKQEHPDDAAAAAAADRVAAEAAKPGAQPQEEAPKPATEDKPAEAPAPGAAQVATPQALDELLTRNPALKAALDASPADKAVLMETARAAEAAKPILRMVPTVEEAKFAIDNTNRFLGLQHKFAMAAEMPQVGEEAWNDFVSLFHVVDDKGNVIKEADGTPRMTESFSFLTQKVSNGILNSEVTGAKAEIARLEQMVEKSVYPTAEAKAADAEMLEDARYRLAAFEYVMKSLNVDQDALALPELPPDATPAQRALQEKLAKEVEQANQQRQATTKAGRLAARVQFERDMNQEHGRGVGAFLRSEIDARKARGEYIPDLLLNRKWINPVTREMTEVSDFAMRVMDEFNIKIRSIPTVNDELNRLQAMGPAGKAARLSRLEQLRTTYLPDIIHNYLTEIQNEVRQMAGQSSARQGKVATIARVEPETQQQPAAPAALSGEALEARAAELLKDDAEYRHGSASERMEMLINKKEEIRAGAAR